MDYSLDQLLRFFVSLHSEYHSSDGVTERCSESSSPPDSVAERLIHTNPLTGYVDRAVELLRAGRRREVLEGQLIGLEQQHLSNYARLLSRINRQMEQFVGETGPTPSRRYQPTSCIVGDRMQEVTDVVLQLLEEFRQDTQANGALGLVYTASELETTYKNHIQQHESNPDPPSVNWRATCNPLVHYISQSAYRAFLARKRSAETLASELNQLQKQHLDEYRCFLFPIRQAILEISRGSSRQEMLVRIATLAQLLFPDGD